MLTEHRYSGPYIKLLVYCSNTALALFIRHFIVAPPPPLEFPARDAIEYL